MPYFNYFNKIINALDKSSLVYINRKSKESNLNTKELSFYQAIRFIIGRLMCLFINFVCLDLNVGDTQAGLKAFIKPKKFNKIVFKSKKFFFDAEIMIIFYLLKRNMKYISVKYFLSSR